MQRNQHPFNGLEQGPDFDRARSMIATPFQYVDIALDVAGVNQIFNVSGDFLYVDASSTGLVTLELNNQYNDPSAPFQVSAGFGLRALFKQLKLTWTAQAGKKIRLMYSTGDRVVPTNSTTVNGIVNTVDGGLSRTLANQAFLGYVAVSAVAGQYSQSQLWNPVGSGKSIYLESVTYSSSTAGSAILARYAAQYPSASATPAVNKYFGNATGAGLICYTSNVAQLLTEAFTSTYITANSTSSLTFKEPVLIPPGQGFVVVSGAVNTTLSTMHEYYEQ